MVIETFDPKETYDLGVKMGEQARAGQVICLNGDLGVGKTVFTQGFAAGLGIAGPVNSPTFTIVQQYEDGRLPLYHLTYIGLVISAKWMRSAMKTAFTVRE